MRAFAPAFALLLASCTTAQPPTQAPPGFGLVGEWRITALNGRPASGSAKIGPHVMIFNFGCNDGRAGFHLQPLQLAPVMPFATTEKGCVTASGEPNPAMQHEAEGFRIATSPMKIDWYGPNRARLSNKWGAIDLVRAR